MTEFERLADTLFGGDPDRQVKDIKFYPRISDETTLEEICRSVRLAIEDVRNGGGEDVDLSF